MIDADADATGVRADVVNSVRNGFAEFLVDEVVHVDLVGTALGPIVAAAVLVGADQFLLLRVDRDHRLAGGLKGFNLRVDVFELSVPVDMMAALQALAIDLAAIAEAFEQLRDPGRRDPMPQALQRQRELRMALGDPHQRPRRVAERRRLQKAAQVFQQRGIGSRERRPSAAGAANLRARAIRRRQILQAAIDRAARDSGRPRHGAHAAVSGRARLRRREQPPLPFVQTHAHRLETVPNRCFINHAAVIAIRSKMGNPHPAVRTRSARIQVDSIVLRRRLNSYPQVIPPMGSSSHQPGWRNRSVCCLRHIFAAFCGAMLAGAHSCPSSK